MYLMIETQDGGAFQASRVRGKDKHRHANRPSNPRSDHWDIVARTGIDEAMIDRLVRTFYGRARLDALIGPIFENKVHDWDKHLGRMCAFWSSVALMSGRYHGQPMVAHLPLPIDTPHFDRWLEIFAQAVHDVCPPAAAAHFLERAQRIAESLELGITAQRGRSGPSGSRL